MESVSEILTPILALYGAALSTYVFYKNMQSRRPTMFVSHWWSYDFLITTQAKRNLSSRSGIGGVLSAT